MIPMSGLLPFQSLVTTLDGRLRRGEMYFGRVVSTDKGLRLLVSVDDKLQSMTFDPKIFRVILEKRK